MGLCSHLLVCDIPRLRQFPQEQKLRHFLNKKKKLRFSSSPHFTKSLIARIELSRIENLLAKRNWLLLLGSPLFKYGSANAESNEISFISYSIDWQSIIRRVVGSI